MSLLDMLSKALAGGTTNPEPHLGQITANAPPDLLAHGIAENFRSPDSPDFAHQIEQLFLHSNSQQQAELLNRLTQAAGSGAASAAGGALGSMPGVAGGSSVSAQAGAGMAQPISTVQASAMRPEQVRDLAVAAQSRTPGVLDQLGGFYAEHPTLLKNLGGAALVVLMAQMKRRLENR